MEKKAIRIFALSVIGLTMAGAAYAQQPLTDRGIPGYLNPKTHTFTAQVAKKDVSPELTLTKYTGKVVFDITTTLSAAVPSGEVVVCSGHTIIDDEDDYYYENSGETLAKVSGLTATCTVTVPYVVSLADATADSIGLSYEVIQEPTSQVISTDFDLQMAEGDLPSVKFPTTTNATTTVTVATTI